MPFAQTKVPPFFVPLSQLAGLSSSVPVPVAQSWTLHWSPAALKACGLAAGMRLPADAVWPVALGLVAGLAGTYYATRIIKTFLFETTPHDAATLALVVAMLGGAAILAAWLPARRAASVVPVAALRTD